METANIQSVVENNIVSVALMNIQPSNYNPRKHFDRGEASAELAESIRQQGVLQPISVRPLWTPTASRLFSESAGIVPPYGRTDRNSGCHLACSDETAAKMAVTENLQRKDVTP